MIWNWWCELQNMKSTGRSRIQVQLLPPYIHLNLHNSAPWSLNPTLILPISTHWTKILMRLRPVDLMYCIEVLLSAVVSQCYLSVAPCRPVPVTAAALHQTRLKPNRTDTIVKSCPTMRSCRPGGRSAWAGVQVSRGGPCSHVNPEPNQCLGAWEQCVC